MLPENQLDAAVHAHPKKRRPQRAWGVLLATLCVLGVIGTWSGIALLVLEYRKALAPANAFLRSGTRLGDILAFVTPFFPAMIAGVLAGNFVVWCIPPARAALGGNESGGRRNSFQTSQWMLAKFGASVSAVALPLCFLGANNFWALTTERIDYRSMFSAANRHYSWQSVMGIETGCWVGKSTSFHFVLILSDRTRLDLMEESPAKFVDAYPQIQLALRDSDYTFSTPGLVGNCVRRAPRRWLEVLARRPTD